MQFTNILLSATLAILASAIPADTSATACPSTLTQRATCACNPPAAATFTQSVNCYGCNALVTKVTGPVCEIECPIQTTHSSGTTTVTSCEITPTPYAV